MIGDKKYIMAALDKKEHYRLNEVLFFLLIQKIVDQYSDYMHIVGFIDACCSLFHCNSLVIQRVMMKIISSDMTYCPRRHEMIVILYRANLSIRAIIDLTQLSKIVIYNALRAEANDPMPIYLHGTAEEAREIKKFLLGFRPMKGII